MKIGLVTIGQAPRDDLMNAFQKRLEAENELLLVGALDGLTPQDVTNLAPTYDEEPLVTQAHNGQPVTIAKDRILSLMQARINELQARDVAFIVVLCTGAFSELTATVPLLLPDVVLRHFVRGVMPDGALGVIVPLVSQQPMMRQKWQDYTTLTMEALDPYGIHERLPAIEHFDGCGLIVLDCMGYTPATRQAVRDLIGKPVILAQDVLAHAVELLVGD